MIFAVTAFSVSLLYALIHHDVRIYDSDLLYLPVLFEDLVTWGGRYTDWKLTPAPYFFPDMLMYFGLAWLTRNTHLSLALVGVFQVVLLAVGWSLLAGFIAIGRRAARSARASTLLLTSLVLVVPAFDWWRELLFVPSIHVGVIIVAPYVLLASVAYLRGRGNPWLLLASAFTLSVLATTSDALFIVQVSVALLIGCATLALIDKRTPTRVWVLMALVIAATIVGSKLYRWIVPYETVSSYVGVSPEASGAALTALLEWAGAWVRKTPAVAFGLGLALVVHGVALVRIIRLAIAGTRPAPGVAVVGMFALVTIPGTLVAIVLTGNFTGPDSERYFRTLTLIPLLTMAIYMSSSCLRRWRGRTVQLGIGAGALALLLICSPSLGRLSALARYYTYPRSPLSTCVDAETDARNLKQGLALYWDAKLVTLTTRRDLRIAQITKELEPYHWISSLSWYERYPPEFVLRDTSLPTEQAISETLLDSLLGDAKERFRCGTYEGLVYRGAQKETLRRHVLGHPVLQTLRAPGDEATFPAASLPSRIGVVQGTSRVATAGKTGHLTFGPYVTLPPGRYRVEIHYEATMTDRPLVGTWDIGVMLADRLHILQRGDLHSDRTSFAVDFGLEETGSVEIRTYFEGEGRLTVHSLRILRLG